MRAIAGLARGGHVSEHRALAAIRLMQELPVSRVPLHVLAESAWALRHNLNTYDAFYVALAQALDCELPNIPIGRAGPALVMTRNEAMDSLGEIFVVLATTNVRGLATEVGGEAIRRCPRR